MTRPRLIAAALLLCVLPAGHAQDTATGTPATANTVAAETRAAALRPFSARYVAYRDGDPIGHATLRLVRDHAPRWRIDLVLTGERGLAGLVGLDLQQSTVFEVDGPGYRPLSQSTVRKGLLIGKRSTGVYDWKAGTAQWRGDVKPRHRAPVALQPGDMSGLLINLAIVRDARPDGILQYRFVEGGRARPHVYRASHSPEIVSAGDVSFEALRVDRTNAGNDETIVWVADGVPTPVRILQREDGEDTVDLRLIDYQGTS